MAEFQNKYERTQGCTATIGAFACSGILRPNWISLAKSANLFKSATEKHDPKKASFTFSRAVFSKHQCVIQEINANTNNSVLISYLETDSVASTV